MALHVLDGELYAFYWGQPFKGVPEVYAAAAAFAMFGPSVAVLKSVTLAVFAAYVVLNFLLLDKIASRWIAVTASLLLIASPATLVFWSLWAGAEYMLIMLLGTTLLLISERVKSGRKIDHGLLLAVGLVIGFGLWDHLLLVLYLIPLGLILAMQVDWRQRPEFSKPHTAALALAAISGLYVVLAVIAFMSGGFTLQLGSVSITATVLAFRGGVSRRLHASVALHDLRGTASVADAGHGRTRLDTGFSGHLRKHRADPGRIQDRDGRAARTSCGRGHPWRRSARRVRLVNPARGDEAVFSSVRVVCAGFLSVERCLHRHAVSSVFDSLVCRAFRGLGHRRSRPGRQPQDARDSDRRQHPCGSCMAFAAGTRNTGRPTSSHSSHRKKSSSRRRTASIDIRATPNSCAVFLPTSGSMSKMPSAREDHRHAVLVRGGDDFAVA